MLEQNSINNQLKLRSSAQRQEVRRWLQLGVAALAIAGLFAVLLVLSRLPGAEAFFPWVDFFRTALVVHVDQSILVWFLAMAGLVWALADRPSAGSDWLRNGSNVLALVGTLGIAAAAFIGEGAPLMNNYLPVLQRPAFFLALGLFLAGASLRLLPLLPSILTGRFLSAASGIVPTAALTIAFAVAVALLSMLWSWLQTSAELTGQVYFEFLFWSGGHTLQFAYSQLLLLAWILLALLSGITLPSSQSIWSRLLLLGVLPVLAVPLIHIAYPVVSGESRLAFTRLMQYGGGLAAVPVALMIGYGAFTDRSAVSGAQRPLRLCLWMSMLLFAAGGVIGILIAGTNTVIPAHYHGSIVGVTLGLMGMAYLLLPRLGYPPVSGRMAVAQPLIYGGGQLLHILGLALSGALGVQRKTAGAAQGLDSLGAKATMGLMGIGGLLAVLGGILFVWIMLRAFWRRAG